MTSRNDSEKLCEVRAVVSQIEAILSCDEEHSSFSSGGPDTEDSSLPGYCLHYEPNPPQIPTDARSILAIQSVNGLITSTNPSWTAGRLGDTSIIIFANAMKNFYFIVVIGPNVALCTPLRNELAKFLG